MVVLLLLSMVMLSTPGGDRAESYKTLREIHADQLADFAASLSATKGSLEAEIRSKALTLARKFHSSNPRLATLKRGSSKPMTTEEKSADKALRKAIADKGKRRMAEEKGILNAPFPDPTNVSEEFEAMRWEMADELADVAEALSLNPTRRDEVGLRKKILT